MSGPMPLALALAAVLALILLTHWLGFSRGATLSSTDEAAELAQCLPGGFAPTEAVLAKDRRAALLRDELGKVVLVAPVGAHFLVRSVEVGWAIRQSDTARLQIEGSDFTAELSLGPACQHWLDAVEEARMRSA